MPDESHSHTHQPFPRTALEESEARYRNTFEHAPVGLAHLSPEGRWLGVNQWLLDLLGYTRDEFRQLRIHDFTHPDDLEADLVLLDRLISGAIGEYRIEKRYVRKDHTLFWAELTVSAVRAPDGRPTYLIGAVKDITDRWRADAVLRESEERHRVMAETASDAIITIDMDSTILFANRATERIFGHRPDELIGRSLTLLMPEYLRRLHSASLQRYTETGVRHIGWQAVELPGLHRDGHEIPLELSFGETRVEGRLHFIGIARDITERSRAAAALKESEARFRAAFEQAAVGMLQIHPSGRMLKANQRLCDMLGYELDELLELSFLEITHPADRDEDIRRVNRLLAGEAASHVLEKRFLRKDGGIVWAEVARSAVRSSDGRVETVISVATDITERRRVEAELRMQAHLLATVEQAMIATDLAGRITYWNQFAERLYGWSAADVLGRGITEVAPSAAAREDAVSQMERLARGESWAGEFEVRRRDGSAFLAQVTNSPILDASGALVGVIGVSMDITDRRHLETQLQHAQKMEAIGRLAGGIAHDFNNLLTAILSNTELVLSELAEGPVREDVEVIRQTAERAAALTRQLLAFSRNQVVQARALELNRVVGESEAMLSRILGERIVMETDLAPLVGSVMADAGQLEQVLINLAVNARDAMPDGGRLRVRTRDLVVREADAARHKGLRPGHYATVTVTDDGVGIPAELQPRIFEPFFTTKGVGEGTGLGLSIVYGIVKQWGGYVAVESAPGKGTSFTIYLPLHDRPSHDAKMEPRAQIRGGTETLLVVEDEEAIRTSIRRILCRFGYTVLEAEHGAGALQMLEDQPDPVALIITDLRMPQMGGRELISRIQSLERPPKVLVVSGYDEQAVMRGESLPVSAGFLAKPFSVATLLQAVRDALDGA